MATDPVSMLRWYINRLRAMDAREVMYRVVELAHRTAGRRKSGRWPVASDAHASPVDHVGALFAPHAIPADIRAAVAHEAASVRLGRFKLLGQRWPDVSSWPPSSAFWHAAPTEASAPDYATDYCADASFHSVAAGRDLKRIWEINRLQFLLPLAVVFRLSGQDADRDLAFSTIFAWMDANPPYQGLPYSDGIELSIRIISVAMMLSVLGNQHLSDAERAKLDSFFVAHEIWLERFPSLHSSENNHRIAELAGLLVCAVVLGRPMAVRQNYLAALNACLLKQLHADGVGAEQAPSYAAFSIELTLIAFVFAQAGPDGCPSELRDRLNEWATYTLWLMDADGRVPEIGDNDAGRGLAMTQAQEQRYVASVASMLAAWLGRPDLAPPARDQHLRDCLFGSGCGPGILEAGIKTWADGGYSIFRGQNASYVLAFDHGPLGHLSIAAHGHADTLAVWLTVGSTPVLIDAGTVTYRPRDPLRDRLRHTESHNTLTVDGAATSIMSGAFNWSLKAVGRIIERTSTAVTASHDGYLKRFSVLHERQVDIAGRNELIIRDRLTGEPAGTQPVVSMFLFGPTCDVRAESENRWTISDQGGPIATIEIEGPLQGRLVNKDATDAGECTTTFGEISRTSKLVCEGHFAKGATQVTTIRLHQLCSL